MACAARFYDDILEALLEPVEANEDDERINEDRRAHARGQKHPNLYMYWRSVDVDCVESTLCCRPAGKEKSVDIRQVTATVHNN